MASVPIDAVTVGVITCTEFLTGTPLSITMKIPWGAITVDLGLR